MYEAFWNGLFDTRWEDAPLGPEAIRLAIWLRKRGYSDRSYRDYAHAVVHLGRVLQERHGGVNAGTLDRAVVENFIGQHLPVCSCYRRRPHRQAAQVRLGLAHLFTMLGEEGVIVHPALAQPIYHRLLDDYCLFLRDDRGLAETTVTNYRRYLRDFLISRGDAVSRGELAQLTANDLIAFGRRRGAVLGTTAWNHLALALSSFYRWLDMCGHGGKHLVGAVPMRRKYRLADVPCALSWEQVQRLLSVVDRREVDGRRNYAILLLSATYGLRSCEVRALRRDNINWSHDEITIFAPKTGRSRTLPLTRPVGEAILDYLREQRPPSRHREVFLSRRPPHGPLRSKINGWLARCFDKAGIEVPRRGAHTLRHSLAVHLLRSGETLKSIADVLGHRSPDTTFIYTKLHVEDLRTVALEPEVVS
jgi:integrase/recombinase XerD